MSVDKDSGNRAKLQYEKPVVETETAMEKQILTTGCNVQSGPPFCWATPGP